MDKVVLKVDYILKNTGVPDAEIGKANEMIHDVISEIRDTMNAQFQDNMTSPRRIRRSSMLSFP